jgi:hypothetical protein
VLQQQLNDVFGSFPFRLGLEIDADAMSQNRNGDAANVIEGDGESAIHRRQGFGTEDQKLPGSRSGSPVHPLIHKFRSLGCAGTCCSHQSRHVINYQIAYRYTPNQPLQVQNGFAAQDLDQFRLFILGGGSQDAFFLPRKRDNPL